MVSSVQNQCILPPLSQTADIMLRLAKSTSNVCKNFSFLRKRASLVGNGVSIVMDVKNIAEGREITSNISKLFFDTFFLVGKLYFSKAEKIAKACKNLTFATWGFSDAVWQNDMSKALNKTVAASKEIFKLMLIAFVSVEVTLVFYLISDITLSALNAIKNYGKINNDGTAVIETGENFIHVAIKYAQFSAKYLSFLQ